MLVNNCGNNMHNLGFKNLLVLKLISMCMKIIKMPEKEVVSFYIATT